MDRSSVLFRAILVGLLALLSWAISAPSTLADDRKDSDPDREAAALLGTWKVVSHDTLGRPASKEFLAKEHHWVFAKDSLTTKDKDGVGRKGTFKLDPKQQPKALDIISEPGLVPGPGTKVPEKEVLKCIYSLDGDTLKVCYGYSQEERPTKFESTVNPKTGLVVLWRQLPPKEKPGKD